MKLIVYAGPISGLKDYLKNPRIEEAFQDIKKIFEEIAAQQRFRKKYLD